MASVMLLLLIMTRPNLTPTLFIRILLLTLLLLTPIILFSLTQQTLIIIEWTFIALNPSSVTATWLFDPISLIFSFTVNLISLSVIAFSVDYINDEKFISRFIILVALFVMSINLFIFMPNLITLLLGWDGLGLVSFLLVVYYQTPRSLGAGIITLMTNRIGDALIISSIAFIIYQGHWNLFYFWTSCSDRLIAILILFAAITKRAQIPFSSWLPAAIAAPTPVSALVHSSTLVTAGVYLLVRFNYFLAHSEFALLSLLILSASTTLIAGLAAIAENDIKKIIALSTLRQLGVIILRLALKAPLFTFFHLITHAIFKALLFICAGSVIHAHNNNQDLRLFGNLVQKIPLTSLSIVIANISLIGIPFIAGFYSKDIIIELTIASLINFIIIIITLISTILTAAYSARFTYFTFLNPQNFTPSNIASDSNLIPTTFAIITLALGAISSGAVLNWLLVFPLHSAPTPSLLKLSPFIIVLLGITFISSTTLSWLTKIFSLNSFLSRFLSSIWFITPNVSYWPTFTFAKSGAHLTLSFDHGWNELLGALGVAQFSKTSYRIFINFQRLLLPYALILASLIIILYILI